MSEQSWGRVADDGTVFVRLPGGDESVVGQFAAGDPDAALAFFGRKYVDLVAEVRLAAERLQKGMATPDQTDAIVARVREQLDKPTFVGDIAGLNQILDAVHNAASERRMTSHAEKTRRRQEALAQREAIAAQAQDLAESTQWKATGERFRTLLDEWKALPRYDKAAEQAIWDRFSAARSTFDKARRAHFAELDKTREQAAGIKEEIVEQAEALADSTEWGPTTRAMRDLMDKWKAAPRAARGVDDKLWARFRAAQDTFFEARNVVNAQRDAEQEKNLASKEELLARAEALLPVKDLAGARRQLRDLQDQWEAIGFVPRSAKESIENRLRKVERAVSNAEGDRWRRSDPVARDRAQNTVDQLQASADKLLTQITRAEETGDSKKVASLSSSLENTQGLLRAAQAVLEEYSL